MMALILAVGLGTVGIAATAQAATGAAEGCTHLDYTRLYIVVKGCYYYNPQVHLVVYDAYCKCNDPSCREEFILEGESREPHDYEQVYLEDGRVYTYCTGCGDSYYF